MSEKISPKVKRKAKDIKLLIMDVDGVLTPGHIAMDGLSNEIKFFDVQDGFGLMLWKKAGLKSAIVTAGNTPAVTTRAGHLKIDIVHQEAIDKKPVYEDLKSKFNVIDKEVCFIGDDLIDLPILKRVGLACCVANGHKDIMPYVHYVTSSDGGRGAVREVIDLILKAKGLWSRVTKEYFLK